MLVSFCSGKFFASFSSWSLGLVSLASLWGFIGPLPSLLPSMVAPGDPPHPTPTPQLPTRHSLGRHPAGRPERRRAAILRANSGARLPS